MREILLGEIDEIFPKAIEIRRYVHAHPELSCEERETEAYVCSILDSYGIGYTVLAEQAGIVASVGKGERVIGIRAELDALPVTEETGLEYASVNCGVMHACGHDIHLASALGFLLMLKKHEDALDCTVKVFFQPAEETVGGGEKMIALGCLENPKVSEVYGFHINPTLPTGSAEYLPGVMNAAVRDFVLTVRGKSCHGAHPEQGSDAIVAASAVVLALQTAVSRRFAPTTPVVVTVGTINGGTAENVVAGDVKLTGTLRALSSDVMKKLCGVFEEICTGTASGYGAKAEIEYTMSYPALRNDPELTEAFFGEVKKHMGEECVYVMEAPSLGADDFAFFAEEVPSCYFNIGCRGEGQGDDQVLHSSKLAPDEGCMKTALEILCMLIR